MGIRFKASLILLIFAVLFVAEAAHAATTLYLPRQFEQSERGTIGVALVNPATTAASATFRLRTGTGGTVDTAQRSIPAKGQLALTLNQLFPNAVDAGWLSVDLDVDQVTGFWMGGDFVTSTDGAPLQSFAEGKAFPWFTYFSSASSISFLNLESSTLTGSLLLKDATGTTITSKSFSLGPFALYQTSVAALFPAQAGNFDSAGYSIVVNSSVSTAKVIGASVTPNPGGDNIVVNAALVGYTNFVFPHIVGGALGGAAYSTILTLTNFRSFSQTVALTLTQSSGASLTIERTLPAFGILRSPVTTLFGLSTIDGWLEVNSADFTVGLVTYTDTITGGSTAVQMQPAGDSNLIFGHIADLSPWWTGIALANTNSIDAQVQVYAFDSSGNLIGGPAQSSKASFTLPGKSKTAFLLGDVIPQTQTRSGDGGYVYIGSVDGVQIYGIELFFLRSGRVYSNVPSTRLGSLAFIPPGTITSGTAPATGGLVTTTAVYAGDANNERKQSFRTGDAITLNMITSNTTGAAVNASKTFRSSSGAYSLINVTFGGTIIAGNNWRYWANGTIPSGAPAGVYTFTGTVDWNGIISTLSTTFRVESEIVISGVIFKAPTESYPFELPLPGAGITIVANNQTFIATSNANGAYSLTLPLSVRDQTTNVIMQVTAAGYIPKGVPVDLVKGSQTVNVTLDPVGANVIVETNLHHLGDGVYSTTLNLGLQLSAAEGLTFTRNFTVTPNMLPPNFTEALLQITVNGAETSDTVRINGAVVARLNEQPGRPADISLSVLDRHSASRNQHARGSGFARFLRERLRRLRVRHRSYPIQESRHSRPLTPQLARFSRKSIAQLRCCVPRFHHRRPPGPPIAHRSSLPAISDSLRRRDRRDAAASRCRSQ